jgi:hypothetical protein
MTKTILNAGQSIILKQGFLASSGIQFLAKIVNCQPIPINRPDQEIVKVILVQNQEKPSELPDQKIKTPFILIYPNPTSSNLNIQVNTEQIQPIEISIQNALGRILTQQKEDISSPTFNTNLDVSDYPPGMYWLKIQFMEDGYWQVIQFVKT